jgi:hypothetical protein
VVSPTTPKCGFTLAQPGTRSGRNRKCEPFPLPEGGDQAPHPQDIEHSPDIVGQGRQAELGSDLFQTHHQEVPLIPPVLDGAKGMFDQFFALLHDLWVRLDPLLSFFNDVFIHPAGDTSVFFFASAFFS